MEEAILGPLPKSRDKNAPFVAIVILFCVPLEIVLSAVTVYTLPVSAVFMAEATAEIKSVNEYVPCGTTAVRVGPALTATKSKFWFDVEIVYPYKNKDWAFAFKAIIDLLLRG